MNTSSSKQRVNAGKHYSSQQHVSQHNSGKSQTKPSSAKASRADNAASQKRDGTGKTKKPHRLTRSELNEQAWQRKRQKKRRGNPPGSRFNVGLMSRPLTDETAEQKDPRIGSKKPVLLITGETTAETKEVSTPASGKPASHANKTAPLSPEQELQALENHPRLDALLDRLEAGETLESRDQQWLNSKLARIEQLMTQLGISDELAEDDTTAPADDILRLLKSSD